MARNLLFLVRASALNRGMATGLENLAWGLGSRGHRVFVLAGGPSPSTTDQNFEVPDLVSYKFVGSCRNVGDTYRKIKDEALQLVRSSAIDCVVSRQSTVLPLLSDEEFVRSDIPVLLSEGRVRPKKSLRKVVGQIRVFGPSLLCSGVPKLRNIDKAVAISRSVAKSLQGQAGISQEQIFLIYRGIDIDFFTPRKAPRFALPKKFRVLFAGSVTRAKGAFDLVASLAHMDAASSGVEIVMCGKVEAGDKRKLEEQILATSGHRLVFLGELSPKDLLGEYRKADAFVLPSYGEGLSKAVLEAMACGLPVVLSDISSFKEIIGGEGNGLMVPVGNPRRIANAIEKLRNEPGLGQILGRNARETVVTSFSLEKELDAWEALIG